MKLFDIMKKADKAEREVEEQQVRGQLRHEEVDERLLALEENQKLILSTLKLKPVKPIVGKHVDI